MRSFIALLAAAPVAFAHYNMAALIVNGNITDEYEYVRQTTNSNSPVTDVTSQDIICNKGGLDADIMAKTRTHPVAPGDEVGFWVNQNLGHPGPLAVYLSKAPDGTSAAEYDGSGDWFKAYELTTSEINEQGLQWASFPNSAGLTNFTFTLPDSLPAGEYLMRAEHIALHGAGEFAGAQFYIGCAQISVSGSGSGTPSPTVQFPGAYDGNEPGLLINIYYPAPTSYTAPGPVTWPNSCEDHTANTLAGSDGDCTGSDGSEGEAPVEEPSTSAPVSSAVPTATSAPVEVDVTSSAAPTSTVVPTSTPSSSPGSGSGSGSGKCKAKRLRRRYSHNKA